MTTTTNPKAPKGFFAGISGIKSGVANIIDAGKTFKTLGPSQVKDEIQIAKHELKTKGIAVGKGAVFFGVAAVFGLFLIIALVAAAILGLGTVMPYWASALVFALIFLIVLFVFFVLVLVVAAAHRIAVGVHFLVAVLGVGGRPGRAVDQVHVHLAVVFQRAAEGRFQVDHVAQQDVLVQKLLPPHGDGLEGQRAFAKARDHGVPAGLDPLGDGDLALARQQLDAAHLSQIHADGVVGAVQLFGLAGRHGQFARPGPGGDDGPALRLLGGVVVLDLFQRVLVVDGGPRQREVVGIHVDPDKSNNVVTWTAGHVVWQGDGGHVLSESIRAGGVQWAPPNPQSTIMYLCWTPGLGYINFTYDPLIYNQQNYVVIGQYYGNNGLVMHWGRTKIDGDYVRTNTISAAHIMAHQINANHLTVSGVVISSEIQVGFGAITDFHFGYGKIDGARITTLDAGKITTGLINSAYLQVGGILGQVSSNISIEGRFGYAALRYMDSNGVTRVEIGQNAPSPDPNRDGFIARGVDGRTLIHANGFGVKIMDENQLLGGSTAVVHYFPGSPDFGFWSAPSTQGVQNRTLWTLRHVPRGANNEVMTGSLWRIVINGNPVFQWIDSEGFPPNNVIDIPAGAWITVNLQAYVRFLDGSSSWQPYNVKIGNDPYWSVHQYAKTYWTILELKR